MEHIISLINLTVEEATKDGADSGGTYESNSEGVKQRLQVWVDTIWINNQEILNDFSLVIVPTLYSDNCFRSYSLVLVEKEQLKNF